VARRLAHAELENNGFLWYYKEVLTFASYGGVMASTWVVKCKEHAGAQGTSLKTGIIIIGNDYALAA
jgi:hypothetical protein